ncbi:MAG TPA: Gfo/Idh/MocA family oxidoreductase [Candidatus Limnocylindria bacterium]
MSRRIGVGVIGCGYWGPNLVRNFAHQDQSWVAALSDMRLERAERLAGWYGVPRVTAEPSELIEDPAVDLVVVATPARTHHGLAKQALQAGKHVLVMKPMATSVSDAEELIDLADRHGVLLAVDHTFVYTAAIRKMRELIEEGALGEIFYIDSVRINLGVFQSDVNVIWDLGAHDVSIVDYLLGGLSPTEVSSVAASHAGSRRENIAYLTMRYGPDLLAHVHVNWLAPAKIRRTIVGGSRQMLVYDDMQPSEKLLIYDRGVTISAEDDPEKVYGELVSYRSGDVLAPRLDDREALAVEADELIGHILSGGTPSADAQSGLRTVRILEAAERSARDGSQPVSLLHIGEEDRRRLVPVPISAKKESSRTA